MQNKHFWHVFMSLIFFQIFYIAVSIRTLPWLCVSKSDCKVQNSPTNPKLSLSIVHGENFMVIFTTLSVVIWFSTGTLGILATLIYVSTMRVVIYDILSMAIIPTLSTSILFCNFCYILWRISRRSVVKIAVRI